MMPAETHCTHPTVPLSQHSALCSGCPHRICAVWLRAHFLAGMVVPTLHVGQHNGCAQRAIRKYVKMLSTATCVCFAPLSDGAGRRVAAGDQKTDGQDKAWLDEPWRAWVPGACARKAGRKKNFSPQRSIWSRGPARTRAREGVETRASGRVCAKQGAWVGRRWRRYAGRRDGAFPKFQGCWTGVRSVVCTVRCFAGAGAGMSQAVQVCRESGLSGAGGGEETRGEELLAACCTPPPPLRQPGS